MNKNITILKWHIMTQLLILYRLFIYLLSKITMPLLAVHTASLRCGALPAPISLLCGSGLQQDSNKQILVGKGIADLPNLW